MSKTRDLFILFSIYCVFLLGEKSSLIANELFIALHDQTHFKLCREAENHNAVPHLFKRPQQFPKVLPITLRTLPRILSKNEFLKMVMKYNFVNGANRKNCFVNAFIKLNHEIILDAATGLMWSRKTIVDFATWEEAKAKIKDLNANQWEGHKDWRLPTIEELVSLIESISRYPDEIHLDPLFPKTGKYFWSADELNQKKSWAGSFSLGRGLPTPKNLPIRVYAVRTILKPRK